MDCVEGRIESLILGSVRLRGHDFGPVVLAAHPADAARIHLRVDLQELALRLLAAHEHLSACVDTYKADGCRAELGADRTDFQSSCRVYAMLILLSDLQQRPLEAACSGLTY